MDFVNYLRNWLFSIIKTLLILPFPIFYKITFYTRISSISNTNIFKQFTSHFTSKFTYSLQITLHDLNKLSTKFLIFLFNQMN